MLAEKTILCGTDQPHPVYTKDHGETGDLVVYFYPFASAPDTSCMQLSRLSQPAALDLVAHSSDQIVNRRAPESSIHTASGHVVPCQERPSAARDIIHKLNGHLLSNERPSY
ncbi:hypothetical protein CPB83DRAFT_900504 [Crepidotus variabilis]|uniref:Uncharacterized protein n=1 Tax=Crepidotus variabilis TaxID=179855 RepID=A0A9P6JHP6_9AGAR|nr:hypothetical protein CPB83DRAFT_900504 [Crepidotus variabilis]